MTHKTGPRPDVLASLDSALWKGITASGATITETMEVLHAINMRLARKMLAPWEDETCPTCPRPADLDKPSPGKPTSWIDELMK